jgi:RNA polymerase sigma factor (sigma-70 family)
MSDGTTNPIATSCKPAKVVSRNRADRRVVGADAGARSPDQCGQDALIGSVAEDGITVDELIGGARRGDQAAWNALVRRYSPLLLAVNRAYRLRDKDAEDVSQMVWLRLIEHLGRIREPRAVPKWIATTARHEAQRVVGALRRIVPMDPLAEAASQYRPNQAEVDAGLLRAEQHQALRDGLAELPTAQRQMLLLLAADPPLSYRQISHQLGIPVGSIGPLRARYLQRLRTTSALHQFLDSSATASAARPR